METLIVYVDRSSVRAGRLADLEAAIVALVEHVRTHTRRSISYAIHLSPDRTTMTVVHVHPDSASLEQLMRSIAPVLSPFRDLLDLRSIDVYGTPSDAALELLEAKARLLGGKVTVHEPVAGVADR